MTTRFSISPSDLPPLMSTVNASLLLDVRRDAAFEAAAFMLADAQRCAPQDIGKDGVDSPPDIAAWWVVEMPKIPKPSTMPSHAS